MDEELENTLNPEFGEVDTNCKFCNLISQGIYLKINLEDSSLLKDFLNRNKFIFPSSFLLVHNPNIDSWQGNYSLTGKSNIENINETWNFVFEFACLTDFAEMEYAGKSLKFSTFVRKVSNDSSKDTKITIFLPSEDICRDAKDNFILNLDYHTQDNYVDTNFDIIVDSYVLHDQIGLFKEYVWLSNPILFISLKNLSDFEEYPRMDIKNIFPK